MKSILTSKAIKKPRLSEILSKKPKPPPRKHEVWVVLKVIEYSASSLASLLEYCRISKAVKSQICAMKALWIGCVPRSLKWPLKAKLAGLESGSKGPLEFQRQLLQLLKSETVARLSSRLASFKKLFAYNSTKENLVTQIIEGLGIEISVYVNNVLVKSRKTMVKKDNCSSYYFSVFDMGQLKYYDTINLKAEVSSGTSSLRFEERLALSEQELMQRGTALKVYAFTPEGNFLFIGFKGDAKIQFMFFQISIMDIVHKFIGVLKSKLLSLEPKAKTLIHSQPTATVGEYLAAHTDFELIVSLYNCKRRALYYINTRLMPKGVSAQAKINKGQANQDS